MNLLWAEFTDLSGHKIDVRIDTIAAIGTGFDNLSNGFATSLSLISGEVIFVSENKETCRGLVSRSCHDADDLVRHAGYSYKAT